VPVSGFGDPLDRRPEAERAGADRQVRRNLEPTPLDVDALIRPRFLPIWLKPKT
jgi:hypothetical protein